MSAAWSALGSAAWTVSRALAVGWTRGLSTAAIVVAAEDGIAAIAFFSVVAIITIDGILRITGNKTISWNVARTYHLPDPLGAV